ncbi:MAG: SMC-Scp complex subunit ScpB [Myxococcales bacterium]|nr:SMC-Scp complex subunit ScpB [Myxococcales bacterium]
MNSDDREDPIDTTSPADAPAEPSAAAGLDDGTDRPPSNLSEAPADAAGLDDGTDRPPSNLSEAPADAAELDDGTERPPSNLSEAPAAAAGLDDGTERPPSNLSEGAADADESAVDEAADTATTTDESSAAAAVDTPTEESAAGADADDSAESEETVDAPTEDPSEAHDSVGSASAEDAPEVTHDADNNLSEAPADPDPAGPDREPRSPDDSDDEPLDPDDPLAAALAELDGPRREAPAGVHLSDELPIDPEDDLRGVEGEASLRLVSILESLLFAAARPLKVNDLRKLLAETSKHQIQLALAHLMAITRDRGIVLAQVAGGFQFRTHPDNAAWVQRMLQTKPARLSRTQIETLAIVAYRQPITRPEIDEVRGVDSGAVLKGLLERELVQIVGKKEEPGRPLLYGTTVRFLEFFNLRGLRDLPTLRDFRDLSEESKATLRTQLGASEAEALGQGVLGFPTVADEGADMLSSEVQTTSQSPEGPGSLPDGGPIEAPGNPSPAEVIPPEPESLPGPSPDEIRPPSPGTDSPDTPDEIRPPSPDIADVPHDPRPEVTDAPSDPGPEIGPGGGGSDTGSGTPSEI